MSTHKTLMLVRHAKSSWKDESLDDIDRPLNKRGLRNAPEMGERLSKLNYGNSSNQSHLLPEIFITSPAVRAYATAAIIAEQLRFDHRLLIEPALYGAGPEDVMAIVRKLDPKIRCALLVGHNPGLTELANVWAEEEIENVPTCGIVIIRMTNWRMPEDGELVGFDYPKKKFED